MTAQRDLGGSVLQVIFSFFLGLVVTAFIGIGVATFYPEPDYEFGDNAGHRLTTSVILLICATLVMVLSLLIDKLGPVLANGALLGGLFTMIYAVGMGVAAGGQWRRLLVVTVALVITVAIGWWKFSRGRPSAQPPAAGGPWPSAADGGRPPADAVAAAVPPVAGHATSWAPDGAVPAAGPLTESAESRLRVVESKLEALSRALNG